MEYSLCYSTFPNFPCSLVGAMPLDLGTQWYVQPKILRGVCELSPLASSTLILKVKCFRVYCGRWKLSIPVSALGRELPWRVTRPTMILNDRQIHSYVVRHCDLGVCHHSIVWPILTNASVKQGSTGLLTNALGLFTCTSPYG